MSLGIWQVHRRTWKLELIRQVDTRVQAPAAAAPGPAEWPNVSAAHDAYRHVRATGVFQHDAETMVQASTALGPGYWVLTPLLTGEGFSVLVNRGFVPPERRDPVTRRTGQLQGAVTVVGLLRITEPKSGFLRANDPGFGRWFSRDVQAIADARHLGTTAPYFVDADATANPGGFPVGGLTVISFPNSHLVYAVTWFALAAMVAGGSTYATREEWRRRRRRRIN